MRAINNFENVQATSGDFEKPTAGGYVVGILTVKDFPMDVTTGKGDYLKIFYDIAEGKFKYYYTELLHKFGGDYYTSFIRSYKDSAAGMFKHFINCVEESNAGYKWNWDEKSLQGRQLGVVLGEEEYQKNDGSVGVRLYVKDIKTVEQIRNGEFKVPELKKLKGVVNNAVSNFEALSSDEDLPF